MFSAALSLALWYLPFQAVEPTAFMGKTIDAWRELIRSRTATVGERMQALWALGCFGPEAKAAVPDIIELVHRGELDDEAISALTAIGANPELAVPRLIKKFIKEGCKHRTAMGTIGFNPG